MSAESDAHDLHHAMKGLGTNDEKLVSIITHRSHEQLLSIAAAYEAKYGKSLANTISKDTSGNYRKVLKSLVIPRPIFFAKTLRKALKGLGTEDGALIDVLAFANNYEIKATVDAYTKLFKRDLVDDIKADTSGNYEHVLVALLRGTRDESPVDPAHLQTIAEKDAHDLYKKGEGRLGTNDDYFVHFFISHSAYHIGAVDYEYTRHHGHGLVEAVHKETSGDFQRVLTALATPRAVYFAKRLHHAVEGLGTNDRLLRRIFVINSKHELKQISDQYEHLYHSNAVKDVKGDTSGWYAKTLTSLLN